ncbi:MAG TPA: antibiotic biosynthesis monooxygenase [Actinospica sp.]|nr:antibiotic biosynthesis monooxygenase [Actinospica sp.]
MFVRVQTFHQPAEELDKLGALVREQFAAQAEPPGFKGFQFLVDRENGKALLVSYWETEEDLVRLEATNAAMRERARERGVEPPVAEVFEVTAAAGSAFVGG